ncbi:MAG: hypothetical protein BGO67_05250 [Alphaproteobacteria bacterium 41-28]|nr:MAG: hypothetical protein BGO67_05250 [Alphaproteobacteria bacterium 41-28]
MWQLTINSYLFKLFFTICGTPLFYVSINNYKENKRALSNGMGSIRKVLEIFILEKLKTNLLVAILMNAKRNSVIGRTSNIKYKVQCHLFH